MKARESACVHIWAARNGRYRSIIFMCKKNTDLSDTLGAVKRFYSKPAQLSIRCIIWLYTEIFKIKVDHTLGPFIS